LNSNYKPITAIPPSDGNIIVYYDFERKITPMSAIVMMAVYQNDVLYSVTKRNANMTVSDYDWDYVTINLPPNAASGCTVKVFVWKDGANIMPYAEGAVLN
jgi:hypothetical protein